MDGENREEEEEEEEEEEVGVGGGLGGGMEGLQQFETLWKLFRVS